MKFSLSIFTCSRENFVDLQHYKNAAPQRSFGIFRKIKIWIKCNLCYKVCIVSESRIQSVSVYIISYCNMSCRVILVNQFVMKSNYNSINNNTVHLLRQISLNSS